MKQNTLFARRYAKALLQIGLEDHHSDKIAEEMNTFSELLKGNEELSDIFYNPIYAPNQRAAVISEVTGKLECTSTVRKFLHFLIEKKRTPLFDGIREEYQELLDERKGILHIHVTSATALSEDRKNTLKKVMQEKTEKIVILHTEEDPSIVGGLVARVGNRIYDGSLKSSFNNMKNHLLSQIS